MLQSPAVLYVLSIVYGKKTDLSQRQTRQSVLSSTLVVHAPNSSPQTMVSTHVPCETTAITQPVIAQETDLRRVLYRTITPYRPDTLRLAILATGITHLFPNLVHDITHGVPIGNPPPLTFTLSPNNLRSANIDPLYLDKFIQDKLDASHFNGPFSFKEAYMIFDGHFHTTPLGFVEKPGSTALKLIRHHSKEDRFGNSMNSWLDLSYDTMKFYTTSDAAEFVSFTHYHYIFLSLPCTIHLNTPSPLCII